MKKKPEMAESIQKLKNAIEKNAEIYWHVYVKNRKLNKNEKKRLCLLLKEEESVAKENLVVCSCQESIPFIHMYEDGICQVSETFYSRMIHFEDINYELLGLGEKEDVLEEYAKFVNYFEPSIQFQLFFFNRKVNSERMKERFEIKKQNDDFDDIRTEYENILKMQAAKGNNGFRKSKYLVFGRNFESLDEARSKLENISKDVIRNLNNLGAIASRMNGYEYLRVLHDYIMENPKCEFDFSYETMQAEGRHEKDYIVPDTFTFEEKDLFETGEVYGKSFYLNLSAPKLNDEFFKKLINVEGNYGVSIHLNSLAPMEASKRIKQDLTKIQGNKIDAQKKAFQGGYDLDILPVDIKTFEQDTMELLEELNSSNQKLFHATITITIFGKSMKRLENTIQTINGIIQQGNCELKELVYEQEQGFFTTAPLCVNQLTKERFLTTKAVSILIPFHTQELFMEGQSMYYGINALSNNMILVDRKMGNNPNGLILGTPGSGKSFAAKREILSSHLQTRDDIIICDPEGEYSPLVNALNGQVVKLATTSKAYLNPMDIQLSHKGDREAIRLKSAFLITLMDVIAGGAYGLGNDEKGIIDACIRTIYDEYFMDPVPEKMPVLHNLYEALLMYDPKRVNPLMEEELCIEAKRQAVRIANSLSLYVNGSQNYFNHRTNVDSESRILCFDIKDLSNQLKEVGMLIVQDAVWNRVSKNREKGMATRYYCDEFHLLLKEKQTAEYAVEMWKRFRKWGGIPTGLTQNAMDFARSADVEGIIGNSDFILLFNMGSEDRNVFKRIFHLSEEQLSHITNSEPGCGLLIFKHYVIPFVDRYPADSKTYAIMNTKPGEEEGSWEIPV